MIAELNIPFEMWLLLVAGVIAGIGRVVEWTQKARKQSAERQREREGHERAILVEPPKPEKAEPRRARVLEIGSKAADIGLKAVFAPEMLVTEAAEKEAPPRRRKRPSPRAAPQRLTLGEFEELLAAQPGPELVEGPPSRRRRRRARSKVHTGTVHSHAQAIAVRIPASVFSDRTEIRQAIVLREILGPPKAALYLKGVRTRN